MDMKQRLLMDSAGKEARYVRQQLTGITLAGVVIFAALVATGLLGEHYSDFFDEDVTFFERNIKEDEHWIYGVIMFLSFFIAFTHTVFEAYVNDISMRLEIARSNGSYERVFNTFFPGRRDGQFYNTWWFCQLQNNTWETLYEVLWIYIALTDLFGIIFILLGRYTAVYTLLRPWKKNELVQMQISGSGKLLY